MPAVSLLGFRPGRAASQPPGTLREMVEIVCFALVFAMGLGYGYLSGWAADRPPAPAQKIEKKMPDSETRVLLPACATTWPSLCTSTRPMVSTLLTPNSSIDAGR